MKNLFTILILLSFAFGILSIVGLISPTKGGFWLVFIKEKKRLKIFGLNLLASFIILIISSIILPTDYYKKGIREIEEKSFSQAIESFNKIKIGDKHYNDKDNLVKNVYESAKIHYTELIESSIKEMDQLSANSRNNSYKEFSGELLFPESYIEEGIAKKIDTVKEQVEEQISTDSYDDALQTIAKLDKIDSLKGYVDSIRSDIKELKLNALKVQIENLVSNEDYIKAQKQLTPLLNDDTTKEYASNLLDKIRGLLVDQLKTVIDENIYNADFDIARDNIQQLRDLGGAQDFIASKSAKIKEIEYQIEFDIIFAEVNEYVKNGKFDRAKLRVKDLAQLNTAEDVINDFIAQITIQEGNYIKAEKERVEQGYIDNAISATYSDLLRNPDDYLYKVIRISGEIDQKINDSEYRMSTKYVNFLGYQGDSVVFLSEDKGFIVGDQVVIYGTFTGINKYSLIDGGSMEVPVVKTKIVDIWIKRS